jgi:hypothetical protein
MNVNRRSWSVKRKAYDIDCELQAHDTLLKTYYSELISHILIGLTIFKFSDYNLII